MALADRLAALTTKPAIIHGTPCSVGFMLDTMPADIRASVDEVLTARAPTGWRYSIFEITEVFGDEYPVSANQVGTHRRGQCRCGK